MNEVNQLKRMNDLYSNHFMNPRTHQQQKESQERNTEEYKVKNIYHFRFFLKNEWKSFGVHQKLKNYWLVVNEQLIEGKIDHSYAILQIFNVINSSNYFFFFNLPRHSTNSFITTRKREIVRKVKFFQMSSCGKKVKSKYSSVQYFIALDAYQLNFYLVIAKLAN